MNLRRLKYFVKIIDVGSLTQAAECLHIAQPALSQQLATLEGEMNQQLLIRTKRGVTPTEAGKTLYAHAQSILRQCEQAQNAVDLIGTSLNGTIAVGLAAGTAAQHLAIPLMLEVQQQHPGIVLHFNESSSTQLAELVINGRVEMAIIDEQRSVKGLRSQPLLKEALYLVCPPSLHATQKECTLAQAAKLPLFLPGCSSTLRAAWDEACHAQHLHYQVKCEIESSATLAAAISAGLGATILPESAARALLKHADAWLAPLNSPSLHASLAFCMADRLPLSAAAEAVKSILLSLISRRNLENHPLLLVG